MAERQFDRQKWRRGTQEGQNRRSSIHFDFNEKALEHRGKQIFRQSRTTGTYFGQVDADKNFDGFARYSDYITYGSDQFTLAKIDESRSPYFKLKQVEDSFNDNGNQNKSRENSKHISAEEKSKNFRQSMKALKSQKKQEKIQEKKDINEPKSQIRKPDTHKDQQNAFDDISSIKKKEISSRKSQSQVLDYLNSLGIDKISSDPQFKNSSKKKYSQIQSKKKAPSPISKQPQSKVDNIQKEPPQKIPAYKAAQARIKEQITRQSRVNQEKNQRKNPVNDDKLSKDQQIDDRFIFDRKKQDNRRVTINDKGKIKRPSDSLTLDHFQFVLPEDLRVQPESSNKKRPRPVETDDEEEQKKEEKRLEQEKPLQYLDVIQEKEDEIAQPAPVKIEKGKKRKSKKEKLADQRITDVKKMKYKPREKKAQSKQTKNKSLESKVPISENESRVKILEKKKKKVIKADNVQVVTEYLPSSDSNNSKYPKRFRTVTLKYWQNQKINYKHGEAIGILSAPKLFELLGFKDVNKLNCKLDKATKNRIIAKISLKVNQKIKSDGFQRHQLAKMCNNQNLKFLQLSCQTKLTALNVIIDDLQQRDINQNVKITEGESFTIQNKEGKMVTIYFQLTQNDQSDYKK